jgi:hypothetical protein
MHKLVKFDPTYDDDIIRLDIFAQIQTLNFTVVCVNFKWYTLSLHL